jgi:serine/threonine-protein kinase
MAPEQLAGREVTAKSDIFSLGLILYEILTGKRVFEAATLPQLMKLRESGTITNPSTLVRDLDPLIERVILRCLEKDPEKRPASALQVAAALPGGDPLAAALAAGETPSPQMVAAAGENTSLAPRIAIACLAAVILGMSLFFPLGIRESGLERLHPENPPEVLAKKSRELLSALGYSGPSTDKAGGFTYDLDFLAYLTKKGSVPTQWDRVLSERPPLLLYWYRQSPREMSPDGFWGNSMTPYVVTFDDPPTLLSGMINLKLDPEGHLTYFQAIPPELEEHPQAPRPPDWSALFAAAGLDLATLHSVDPTWNSLASSDARAAWEGNWPGSARRLHVEAAAWRGTPVFFALSGPWTKPQRMNPAERTRAEKASQMIGLIIALVVLAGAVFLARRNYVRGKGDRRGALRIASVVFVLELSICLFRAHFTVTFDAVGLFILAVSTALFVSGSIWVLYLALEPYVRRNWPQTIISWTRLLAGRLRDPLVGRDLLFGTLLGMLWSLVFAIFNILDMRAGAQPQFPNTEFLLGFRETSANWLLNLVGSIQTTLVFFFFLLLLRVLARNRWVAAALFVLLFSAAKVLGGDHPMIEAPMWLLIYTIAAVAVVRFGLIVLAVGIVMVNVLLNLPYTLDFSLWYAARALCVVFGFVVLAIWGFYTSLAGQRLWKDELFD